jgi:hypothetical protein
MNAMRLRIVADHGGFAPKLQRLTRLRATGRETVDVGARFPDLRTTTPTSWSRWHARWRRAKSKGPLQFATAGSSPRSVRTRSPEPYYVDVTHPQDKGEVVRCLSNTFEVPMRRIATIGDMANDVLPFTVSGLGIAVGNASTDVQRTARWVTSASTRWIRQGGRALRAAGEFLLNERQIAQPADPG